MGKIGIRKRKNVRVDWEDKNRIDELRTEVMKGATLEDLEKRFHSSNKKIKEVCKKNKIVFLGNKKNRKQKTKFEWTPEKRKTAREMYNKGMSYAKIAEKFEITSGIVRFELTGKNKSSRIVWTPENVETLLKLEQEGKSFEQIAEYFKYKYPNNKCKPLWIKQKLERIKTEISASNVSTPRKRKNIHTITSTRENIYSSEQNIQKKIKKNPDNKKRDSPLNNNIKKKKNTKK